MKEMLPPDFDQLNEYYKGYVKYWEEKDLLIALSKQSYSASNWMNGIPERLQNHAYAEGKWMLKEVIGHLIDTERVMAYRAMCISRNDKTSFPAFDENEYIRNSNYKERTMKDIVEEWKTVRSSTISLFNEMTNEMADRQGTANNNTVTARIILFFILVHERHHIQLMKDRYLTSAVSA